MSKFLLIPFLMLMLMLMLMVFACFPSTEEIKSEFEEAVGETRDCVEHVDCQVIYPGCPLGCFIALHKDDAGDMQSLANELIPSYESGGRACDYECLQHDPPSCVEHRCRVEGADF